jgi:hypothetical protein
MAGDWIKMRCNLWDDPRISNLCDSTGEKEAAVIGGLYRLWVIADQHSEHGVLPGLTVKAVDRKTCVKGLGEALVAIGWLVETPEGVQIARFDEHNGESAKVRAQTARRVAKHKSNAQVTEKVTQETLPLEEDSNGDSVTSALPREEKRREDINSNAFALPEWVPDDAWKDFEQMRVKRKKPLTDRARALAVGKLDDLRSSGHDVRAVIEQSVLHSWDTFYELKGGRMNGHSDNVFG